MEKECLKCKKIKLISLFYKDAQKPDGRRPTCIDCWKEYIKIRRRDPEILGKIRYHALKYQKKRMLQNYEQYREYNNKIRREKYHSDEIYRDKIIKRVSERKTRLRKENPAQRAIDNARARVRSFLKRKTNSYSHHIGCKKNDFKIYMESLFQSGMTWENYGKWEIDHKIPLMLAYNQSPKAFQEACNYKNLQPLWIKDHQAKTMEDVKLIKAAK